MLKVDILWRSSCYHSVYLCLLYSVVTMETLPRSFRITSAHKPQRLSLNLEDIEGTEVGTLLGCYRLGVVGGGVIVVVVIPVYSVCAVAHRFLLYEFLLVVRSLVCVFGSLSVFRLRARWSVGTSFLSCNFPIFSSSFLHFAIFLVRFVFDLFRLSFFSPDGPQGKPRQRR